MVWIAQFSLDNDMVNCAGTLRKIKDWCVFVYVLQGERDGAKVTGVRRSLFLIDNARAAR